MEQTVSTPQNIGGVIATRCGRFCGIPATAMRFDRVIPNLKHRVSGNLLEGQPAVSQRRTILEALDNPQAEPVIAIVGKVPVDPRATPRFVIHRWIELTRLTVAENRSDTKLRSAEVYSRKQSRPVGSGTPRVMAR